MCLVLVRHRTGIAATAAHQTAEQPTKSAAEQTPQPAAAEGSAATLIGAAATAAGADTAAPHGAGREKSKQGDAQRFGQASAGYCRAENIIEQTHDPGSLAV